jgi:hypothetical protein
MAFSFHTRGFSPVINGDILKRKPFKRFPALTQLSSPR